MKFTKDNLEDLARIMDERLLKFHEEITEPMVNNIYERLHEEVAVVADNTYRIEKKLDNIAEHEKRLIRLEGRAVASL
ncbi:MAG: hypothetical protein UW41_C0010G0038 [Candidatus Collierbacteria bacterium GW2011_GWC2_44_18]|uniref:Uncharacterized protein n=2 Tax=Microgenomates group TaxID=1794810 RepID=A0A0G1J897_9BACT|nr:MAG: hypothetical protein UW16_C0004G0024 [Microgenomates group bacterium GW2011_GWC1_44_10]KKT49199.1 MAG: hypothetical protein UW41_C0010G0038 [Candidatus Collierbacteria bacterium GW2011_GWC2_44_18]KKT67510.1 MAG: hypothetical protein UW60_C0005G0024 [Candidatus Woesebacteria bacterium GW2011_GWA2_44_33]